MTTVTSRNPASGEIVFEAPSARPQDVTAAARAADAAQQAWHRRPMPERAEVLRGFADLVEGDAGHLAALIVAEVGKLRGEADGEVAWTALSARWYADHPPAERWQGPVLVRQRPLGVIAAVTPWNVPLITPAWKLLPALMAGNSVVWKPSERASATALAARDVFQAAGLPDGVLQVVLGGPDVARALCGDPRVAGIHVTGSTRAGRALGALAAERFAACSLELSGINVAVVFADADLDLAADAIVAAATALNGQKCTATRRVLADQAVAARLTAKLAERLEALRPGDPLDPATTLGPLVSPEAAAAAAAAVDGARRRGARILARSPEGPGPAFSPATLLGGVAADDPLHTEEVFAPVVQLEAFDDPDAAWAAADRGPYGLSGAVFTQDQARVREGLERLRTGVLAVNRRGDAVDLEAPFAGMKASGVGAPEGGTYAYAGLTAWQAVYGLGA